LVVIIDSSKGIIVIVERGLRLILNSLFKTTPSFVPNPFFVRYVSKKNNSFLSEYFVII